MPQVKWLIHLKDGKTLTSNDCYPHDVPQETITSVERIVELPGGRTQVASVLKSEVLTNFFVKTTASKEMRPFGGSPSPTVVEERIVGAFVLPQETPVRLELIIDKTGKVKLRTHRVNIMRKDGL